MRTELAIRDGALVISYEVDNTGERTLYLINRLHRGGAPPAFDPNLVYVKLRFSHALVDVTKRVLPIPEGFNVYARRDPHPTKVETGRTFREEIHVPLPIRQHVEYEREPEEVRKLLYRAVRFSVQAFFALPGSREEQVDADGVSLLFVEPPAGRLHEPFLLESPVVALRIPVLEPVREASPSGKEQS